MDKRPQIIKEKLESTLVFNVKINQLKHAILLDIEGINNVTHRKHYMIELLGPLITVYTYNNISGYVENMKVTTNTLTAINYILSNERKTILKNVKNLLKKVDTID